jgi:iron complex outermembrane receptor protein
VPLRIDANRVVGPDSTNRFPITKDERDYTVPACTINTVARPGLADVANTCGSTFDERYNPSNTGNIRINSRFSLTDKLVLTVDPSYQYTLANGGGTVVAQERLFAQAAMNGVPATNMAGYINGTFRTSVVTLTATAICSIPFVAWHPAPRRPIVTA